METYEQYLKARDHNRESFRQGNSNVYRAFEASLRAFDQLAHQLRDGRDSQGATHISLGPLFFLFQRQSMAAYESLAAGQAYLAWGHLRPGVEAALMIGKWVDDPRNADVWSSRATQKKEYANLFQGKGLTSAALPRAGEIRSALSAINDLFLHPNPDYYHRHLKMSDLGDGIIEMKVEFFDKNDDLIVGIFGILHLVIVIQDSLAAMFAKLFSQPALDVGLASFEATTRDGCKEVMANMPEVKKLLLALGLWSDLTAT